MYAGLHISMSQSCGSQRGQDTEGRSQEDIQKKKTNYI